VARTTFGLLEGADVDKLRKQMQRDVPYVCTCRQMLLGRVNKERSGGHT
jgi:hypothetical protein